MTRLSITIREEDQRFIEAGIKSGRYVSESEAVADALMELRAREDVRQVRLAELRAQIGVGLSQLDNDEGEEWNAAEIMAAGRSQLAGPNVSTA